MDEKHNGMTRDPESQADISHIKEKSDESSGEELVTVEKGYERDELHGDLTPEEKHRALRKCDYRLIPLLGVLYLVAFIDRSNIGNARIAGMEEDLNLQGMQYNIAVTMFFVSYGSAFRVVGEQNMLRTDDNGPGSSKYPVTSF